MAILSAVGASRAEPSAPASYSPTFALVRDAVIAATDYAEQPVLASFSEHHVAAGRTGQNILTVANGCEVTDAQYWSNIGTWLAVNTDERPRRIRRSITFVTRDMRHRVGLIKNALEDAPQRVFLERGDQIDGATTSREANLRQRAEWLAYYDTLLEATGSLHASDSNELGPAYAAAIFFRARCAIQRSNSAAVSGALGDGDFVARAWSPSTAASILSLTLKSEQPEIASRLLDVGAGRYQEADLARLRAASQK